MVLLSYCGSQNIFLQQTQIFVQNRLYSHLAIKIVHSSKLKHTMPLRCIKCLCSFCWLHDFPLVAKIVSKYFLVCKFVTTLAI